MSWLIAIIVGGLTGWIASLIMKTDRRQNLLLDIIFGIIGALLARWFFGSVLGIGSALAAGTFSLLGIVWGIVGAAILIGIVRAIMPERRTGEMGKSYHEEIRKRKEDQDKHNNLK